jgi:hypothetical protein
MSELSRPLRWAVAAVCAYEVAAIATDRTPTVSHLCYRRRWLTPVILTGLGLHLVIKPTSLKEKKR